MKTVVVNTSPPTWLVQIWLLYTHGHVWPIRFPCESESLDRCLSFFLVWLLWHDPTVCRPVTRHHGMHVTPFTSSLATSFLHRASTPLKLNYTRHHTKATYSYAEETFTQTKKTNVHKKRDLCVYSTLLKTGFAWESGQVRQNRTFSKLPKVIQIQLKLKKTEGLL